MTDRGAPSGMRASRAYREHAVVLEGGGPTIGPVCLGRGPPIPGLLGTHAAEARAFHGIRPGIFQQDVLTGDMRMKDSRPEAAWIEPLSVRIPQVVRMTGLSRSKIYELIASGDLEAAKIGRATVVLVDSLKRLLRENRKVVRGRLTTLPLSKRAGG